MELKRAAVIQLPVKYSLEDFAELTVLNGGNLAHWVGGIYFNITASDAWYFVGKRSRSTPVTDIYPFYAEDDYSKYLIVDMSSRKVEKKDNPDGKGSSCIIRIVKSEPDNLQKTMRQVYEEIKKATSKA